MMGSVDHFFLEDQKKLTSTIQTFKYAMTVLLGCFVYRCTVYPRIKALCK